MATTKRTPKTQTPEARAYAMRHPKGKNAVPASWATIGAELGVSAGTARRLYDKATGVPGSSHTSRIPGKGGRTAKPAEAVAA